MAGLVPKCHTVALAARHQRINEKAAPLPLQPHHTTPYHTGAQQFTLAGQGVNLEDAFARLYLARLCAHVVHSDQSSTDVSRDGAPFWQMLRLLATR